MKAISVNPVDAKRRAPKDLVEKTPRVLGWDVAGVVKAVGAEVSLFKPGDAVFGGLAAAWSNWGYMGFALVPAMALMYRPVPLVNALPADYSMVYGPERPFAPSLARTASGGATPGMAVMCRVNRVYGGLSNNSISPGNRYFLESAGGGGTSCGRGASKTMKSLPSPCIFVKARRMA